MNETHVSEFDLIKEVVQSNTDMYKQGYDQGYIQGRIDAYNDMRKSLNDQKEDK